MATLRTLAVNVVANAEPLRQGLRQARGDVDKFAAGFGGMGGTLLKIAGVAGVAALAFKSASSGLAEFSAKEDAITNLNSVLQATGFAAGQSVGGIKQLAESLESTTKFGDDATIAAASLLATFRQVKGDVFKDAIKSAQDLSTVFGGDLQGSVRLLGKALNNPTAGLTALTRAGVSFTEQQKDQIKALQASGNLLGAQQMILNQLNKTVGGAAVAAGNTLSGSWEKLKNAAGDLGAAVMQFAAPAIKDLLHMFTRWADSTESGLNSLGKWIGLIKDSGTELTKEQEALRAATQAADEHASAVDEKLITSLEEQAATFGMTAREATIYKAGIEGATEAAINQAEAINEQLTAWEAHKKLVEDTAKAEEDFAKNQEQVAERIAERGKSVWESTRTAAEQYQHTLKDLQSLLRNGAIDWDTYGRAVKQAAAEMQNANGAGADALGPRMLLRGQQETLDRVSQGRSNTELPKLVTIGRDQLGQQKIIVDELKRARQQDTVINNPPPIELV